MDDDLLQQTCDYLRRSKRLVVLTGAGISRESGVPTFRDATDGLWSRFDPTELANAVAFVKNPKLVWDWYEYRRDLVRRASPNPGHYALAALQRRFPSLTLITQNVDDLHERAGSVDVVRLHGSIAHSKCFYNCQGDPTPVDVERISWDKSSGPPPCPHCGRFVRPDVVWFGEMLPPDAVQAATEASAHADVMLVIGTSGLVRPAADLPFLAKRGGAVIIEVNPTGGEITPIADIWLQAPSGEALPRVVAWLDRDDPR